MTDVFAAVGSLGEGMAEALQTFVKNPGNPGLALAELLEGIRDAIIHLLDAGENITLALLDVVEAAVKALKLILNFDFRIPFISQLFEFIGAGKLTILNISCLLLAIPTTIAHKLAFNERPFADDAPLEFSVFEDATADTRARQPAQQKLARAQGADQQQPGENQPDNDDGSKARSVPPLSTFKGFGVLALVANGLQGTVFNLVLNASVEGNPADKAAETSPMKGLLEMFSFLMDVASLIPAVPGLLKVGTFKDASAAEKALFFIRAFQLALDLVFTVKGWLSEPADRNTQRMKRADENTIMLFSALSAVELIAVLVRSKELLEDKESSPGVVASAAAAEFYTVFPKPWAMLRMTDPNGVAILIGMNFVSTAAVVASGSFLFKNDVDAIEAL